MNRRVQEKNSERASHAERTVRHYSRVPGYRGEPDHEADVSDLLTDLRHFCARVGLDFDELYEASSPHYEAERKGQDDE